MTWIVKSGFCSTRRPRADRRIQRGNHVERDEQHRDERAHRALVGRQLDVEIRQPEQPDEGGDRRARADERRVPGLDRLHADEEGVGQDAAAEDRGRQPADARVAPREMRDVRGRGGGVQQERQQMHSA